MKSMYRLVGLGSIFAFLFLAPLTANAQGGTTCEYSADCAPWAPICYIGTCDNFVTYGVCDYSQPKPNGASCSQDSDPTTIEKCNGSGSCIEICTDVDLDGYCDEDLCPGADDDIGCTSSSQSQTVEINRNYPNQDGETYSFSVGEGTPVSASLHAFYGPATLETRWVHGGAVVCTRNVSAGQTLGCNGSEMIVPTGTETVYVTVTDYEPGTTFTLTIDYTTPAGGWICRDDDYDGICNADDQCPAWSDLIDSDGDGTSDCLDGCAFDPGRTEYGICGCGTPIEDDSTDSDGDGVADCRDICAGFNDNEDQDFDGTPDGCDICQGFNDDYDYDNDGTPNGCDNCPSDGNKTETGVCGCGAAEDLTDADMDGVADCVDSCIGTEEYCSCEGAAAWTDETTGLKWEGEVHDFTYQEAVDHCNNLVIDGNDNWRVPTIDELRTLILGCSATAPVGDCGITDPDCLDGNDPSCTDFCYVEPVFPPLPPLCANPSVTECLVDTTMLYSSSANSASTGDVWGVNYMAGELLKFPSTWNLDYRCVSNPCDKYDVVGNTQLEPTIELTPDGQVTFGMANWWEDDVYACYNTYLNAAYLTYFPKCDLDGSGAVEVQEVLDIYYFVLPYITGSVPAYAYQCH